VDAKRRRMITPREPDTGLYTNPEPKNEAFSRQTAPVATCESPPTRQVAHLSTPNDPMPTCHPRPLVLSPTPPRGGQSEQTRMTRPRNMHERRDARGWPRKMRRMSQSLAAEDRERWETRPGGVGRKFQGGGEGSRGVQRVWAPTLRLTAGNPRKLALRGSKGLACVLACCSGWRAGEEFLRPRLFSPRAASPCVSMPRVTLFLPARDYFAHVCFAIPRDRRAPGREIGRRRVSGVQQPGPPRVPPPRGCRLISGRLGFG